MRALVSLMHLSLDGFTARVDGSLDFARVDEPLHEDVGAYIHHQCDTAVYGRKTYELMHGYWPTVRSQPNPSKFERDHTDWVEKVEKVVFSRSGAKVTWNNARLAPVDLKAAVAELKGRPGKDALIFGSPSLTRSLAALGLIDEYRLTFNPELLGNGLPMFDDRQPAQKLSLVSSKTYASGLIAAHYRVVR